MLPARDLFFRSVRLNNDGNSYVPATPPYYRLYKDFSQNPNSAPEPSPPIEGTYVYFGGNYSTDDVLPSLEDQGVRQLYPKGSNIDFKNELRSLNRELQLHILELADVLVERPHRVEEMSLIFKSLHRLLNSLRPHQARATLIHILELQRQRCKQALEDIKRYSYNKDTKKLDQTYCDPSQRLVADCVLTDVDTAVVSDCKGSIAVLSCSDHLEDNASPERNLTLTCAYYMGEIAMSIREEHELLEAVQARLIVHPSTAPVLGNDHNEYHSRENPVRVPKILDGDMLAQFLELTSMQQEAVLSFPIVSPDTHKLSSKPPPSHIPVNKVVQLLERIHYALN